VGQAGGQGEDSVFFSASSGRGRDRSGELGEGTGELCRERGYGADRKKTKNDWG
jgi:hypothetical protein